MFQNAPPPLSKSNFSYLAHSGYPGEFVYCFAIVGLFSTSFCAVHRVVVCQTYSRMIYEN